MLTNREIYKIWAPAGAKWVDWVRPVPFVEIKDYSKSYKFSNLSIAKLIYLSDVPENTAIFLDLPGYDAIKEGLALARLGMRPIPIYNGTNEQPGSRATVDNHAVEIGLWWGASELVKIPLKDDAAPVFLLDSNRVDRYKMSITMFDNSWDIYPQDVPSAEYFLNNGINKIILRTKDEANVDLKKILYTYQEAGIKIYYTDGYIEPVEADVLKIKTIKRAMHKDE